MASLFTKLRHSFINTLFYLWTVIQALLFFRSTPFSFHRASTAMPYPLDLDVEQGDIKSGNIDGPATRSSPVHGSSNHSATPRNPALNFAREATRIQGDLFYLPAFSSGSMQGNHEFNVDVGTRYVNLSAPRNNLPFRNPSFARANTYNNEASSSGARIKSAASPSPSHGHPPMARFNTPARAHYLAADPFVDISRNSPLSFISKNHHLLGGHERTHFKLPFLTSTPPRACRDGRGHRRGPFDTITNITHVTCPRITVDYPLLTRNPSSVGASKSYHPPVGNLDPLRFTDLVHPLLLDSPGPTHITSSPPSPGPLHVDSPGPSLDDSSLPTTLDTSVPQRPRSLSLRRKPAYGDLHSPSPPRSSPQKRPTSRFWFNPAKVQSITPLRIIKRSIMATTESSDMPAVILSQSNSSEPCDLHDVVSKVRAVLDVLRKGDDDDDDDEGVTARELINRESLWSCESAPADPGTSTVPGNGGEESDEEEEYGDEVATHSLCSPPPPYALSVAFTPSDLYANLKRDSPLGAFKFFGTDNSNSTNVLHLTPAHGQGFSATVPTEISYLQERNNVVDIKSLASGEMSGKKNLQIRSRHSQSFSTAVSTEISYLKDDAEDSTTVVAESVDSSLDAILLSFENLINSMGPKYKVSVSRALPALPMTSKSTNSRPDTGFYVYGGLAEECDAQWCDIFELDNYDLT